ncbi:WD_REPEATS_REGION domain-containing protein [Azospirillaceae bacterium]
MQWDDVFLRFLAKRGAAVLIGAVALGASSPTTAQMRSNPGASASVLRAQTQAITGAISRQVQSAFRPHMQIRNSVGQILEMEMAPDGRLLAIVSADNAVRVWDLENGRQTRQLQVGDVGSVRAVDVGVSGVTKATRSVLQPAPRRVIATGGDNGAVIVWENGSGVELRRFSGHQGAVNVVRLSHDGALLASAGVDGVVRLWEMETGKLRAQLPGHSGGATALAFSASGQVLATGGGDGVVRLWSPAGATLKTIEAHSGGVRALAFNAFGDRLYSGGADGKIRSWSTSGEEGDSWKAAGAIGTLVVGKIGNLVSVTNSGEVQVWESDGSRLASINDSGNRIKAATFTPDGKHVITAGEDGLAKVWDVEDTRLLVRLILTSNGWAVADSSGRFDGSDRGINNVTWVDGQLAIDMSNFGASHYEPGLLAKTLRNPGALLTSSAPSVEEGVPTPPLSSIDPPGNSSALLGKANIVVTAEDVGGGIKNVRLFHNDKAVDASRIVSDSTGDQGGRDARVVVFAVDLLPGENRFRAMATSAGDVEGPSATATISTPQSGPVQKSAMHVVAIGINQYSNPEMTLNYAVADARGFVDWARRQTSNQAFSKVQIHELYDQQATRAGIQALFQSLQSTNSQDVVIMYFAGHGESVQKQWYFLPTEFGRNMTAQAVAAEGVGTKVFQDAILKMGAQRVFMLLDACKSGTLGKAFASDVDSRDIQSMSRDAGIHIMAATDKNQLAVELAELGHGAFTYTVLDALKGVSPKITTDGIVRAKAVLYYAADQVPSVAFKYTGMEQFPTVFSRGGDFEIGRVVGGGGGSDASKRKKKND